MPDYDKLTEFASQTTCNLWRVYSNSFASQSRAGYNLLSSLLEYDPGKRITPNDAIAHAFFEEMPVPSLEYFFLHLSHASALNSPYSTQKFNYPLRKIYKEGDPSENTKKASPGPSAKAR